MDTAARNALVEEFAGHARYLARRLWKHLQRQVDIDDLRSWAYLGLIDAAERYDPDRGIKFRTYATPRIQGAMIDEMRKVDHLPRTVREQVKRGERADLVFKPLPRALPLVDLQASRLAKQIEARDLVAVAMRCLNDREKRMIELIYLRGLSQEATANKLGVCPSRVSQTYRGLLDRMRARLIVAGEAA